LRTILLRYGRSGSSFVVNAASPKKEQAIAFLKWLTIRPAVYLANMTNNLPANRNAAGNLTPILANFLQAMDNTTHPSQADAGKTRGGGSFA